MEPFENNEAENIPAEPAAEPAIPEPILPEAQPYHGAGTGRKESPYANSPYMTPDPEPELPRTPKAKKEKKQRSPRKLKKWHRIILGAAAAVILVGGTFLATSAYWVSIHNDAFEDVTESYNDQIADLQEQIDDLTANRGSAIGIAESGGAMTPAQLYASSVNSVVAISTTYQQSSYYYGTTEATSAGSGFILSADGYVITNYHVVEDATKIQVITHDGTEYEAKLVGHDSTNDLAVLDIEAENLPAAPLGTSSDLVIGDMVVAIGNPLGELASTQTVGYVSGIDREVSTDGLTTISMIQTDAAINPGNSGGPLFNMNGEVIGITTAKYSGTTGSGATIEGIGFAIPIDDVEPLIDDLIDYGYVTGAYMGVSVQNVDESAAAQFGLPTGAYIVDVDKGGAADRAGIQPKDIVIDIDDIPVSNVTDLTRALRNYKAGDTATVKLIRSGREMTLEITLDEKPQQTSTPTETQPQQEQPQETYPNSYDDMFDYFFRRFFGE